MIELTREIARQIGAEGEKTYPNECCGALFGHLSAQGDGRVTAIFPIVNARESEEQYHRFVITAAYAGPSALFAGGSAHRFMT